MVKETLNRLSLVFEFEEDSRFTYSNVKKDASNSQLHDFASAFNSLQRNVAHTFSKEQRYLLERDN